MYPSYVIATPNWKLKQEKQLFDLVQKIEHGKVYKGYQDT